MAAMDHQTSESESELWKEVYTSFEFHRYRRGHPPDFNPQAALNRVAAKCIGIEACTFSPSNCRIHRELLTNQQLNGLRRHHQRDKPHRDYEPIIVIQFGGHRWVVDGNTRVNKWVSIGNPQERSAIVITPDEGA